MITLALAQILLFMYAMLIVWYGQLWRNLRNWVRPEHYSPSTPISVIIPARNEEKNIRACLDSIISQQYPSHLLEIIVVDDAGTDSTADIVSSFNHPCLKLIRLSEEKGQAKKRAIAEGISASSGKLIVTTDADCICGPRWLLTIASFYEEKRPACIAAPVVLHNKPSLLAIFQSLDFMSLQGVTAVSVAHGILNMANGANFAYERSAYEEVNGFAGISHLASGDDMLLMQKIAKQYPGRVSYCLSGDVLVSTQPAASLSEFFRQRIRWASKARFYQERTVFYVLLLVYLMNISLMALVIHAFFEHILFWWWGVLIVFKFMTEMFFMYPVVTFFKRRNLLWFFLPAQPFHIIYTVIAGLFGQAGTYTWKGRTLR